MNEPIDETIEMKKAPKMKTEEEIYMKMLTGMVLGGTALKNYQRIAVVGTEHILSASASSAILASFIPASKGNAAYFVAKKGEVKEMVANIAEFDPEIVVMLYAESPEPGLNRELFLETMREMTEIDLEADLLFDPMTLDNGNLAEGVKPDDVQRHMQEIESFVFTLDLDNGKIVMNIIEVDNGEVMVDPIEEYKLTVEHTVLLNRGLRGKTLKWE